MANLIVVCIDNDETILDGMQTLMDRWGCDVHVFSQSKPLLKAIKDISPDIILADYHLDQENGLDVVCSAREQTHVDLPAILITADRSAAVRNAAEALEITVMNKPLKPAALRALFGRLANKNAKGKAPTAAE